MLEDLTEHTNLEAGKLISHSVNVDLTDLVRQVCNDFQEFHSSHRLVAALPKSPVWAPVDRDKTQRMLENLLTNAYGYSPKGSTVSARLREPTVDRPYAVIEVEDEGEGIPEGLRSAIFSPFVRVEDGRRPGQGLGLYIVKSLAESHGGSAWVESSATGGARFCFALPADLA
jgi:signal transduction histidine kinase